MTLTPNPWRSAQLAADIFVEGNEFVNLLSKGAPADGYEFVAVAEAVLTDPAAGRMIGEVFVAIDPATVDEVIAIAKQIGVSDESRERQIRNLIGSYLWPAVGHRDGDGDLVITVTDGERAQS